MHLYCNIVLILSLYGMYVAVYIKYEVKMLVNDDKLLKSLCECNYYCSHTHSAPHYCFFLYY